MKKAIIIGCPGSGKTTFSKVLAAKTGLPLVHLDPLYHIDGETIDRKQFDAVLERELMRDEWIMDGNYNRTISYRLGYCDTVFYFDLPTAVCLSGVIKRTLENYGKVRNDGINAPERFDRRKLKLIKAVINFKRQHRVEYQTMLRELEGVDVVIFRSHKQAEEYLERLGD